MQFSRLYKHNVSGFYMHLWILRASNTYRTGCVLQEFADAIFHLVGEKYTELAGCSSLLHARHKGLAGIVMTRGTPTLQSTPELFNQFNIERMHLCVSSECGSTAAEFRASY